MTYCSRHDASVNHAILLKKRLTCVVMVTSVFVISYLYETDSTGKNQVWSEYCSSISVPYKFTPNKAPVIASTMTCKEGKKENVKVMLNESQHPFNKLSTIFLRFQQCSTTSTNAPNICSNNCVECMLKQMLKRLHEKANIRNDQVIMFILHLPLVVFSFPIKFSSFALASKARIILH